MCNKRATIIALILFFEIICKTNISFGYGGYYDYDESEFMVPNTAVTGNIIEGSRNEEELSYSEYIETNNLEGYIYEKETANGIEGILVRLIINGQQIDTYTNEDGYYEFDLSNINEGKYDYNIYIIYPGIDIDKIENLSVEDAEKMQERLKYNTQDYVSSIGNTSEKVTAIKKDAIQVMVALDISPSMLEELDNQKKIAIELINKLFDENENVYIGLGMFNGANWGVSYPVDKSKRNELISKMDVISIENAKKIDDMGFPGLSCMIAAVAMCDVSCSNVENRYIFVISDGLITGSYIKTNGITNKEYEERALWTFKQSISTEDVTEINDRKIEFLAKETKETIEVLESTGATVYFATSTKNRNIPQKTEDLLYDVYHNQYDDKYNFYREFNDDGSSLINEFSDIIKNASQETIRKTGEHINNGNEYRGDENFENKFSKFNFDNTKYFKAIDMKIDENNVGDFTRLAKELLENVQANVKLEGKIEIIHETGNTRNKSYRLKHVYLEKLPEFIIDTQMRLSNLQVIATNGQILYDSNNENSSGTDNIYSIINKEDIYGSKVVLIHEIVINNISEVGDSTKLTILCHLPKYMTTDFNAIAAFYLNGTPQLVNLKEKGKEKIRMITDLTGYRLSNEAKKYVEDGEAIVLEIDIDNNNVFKFNKESKILITLTESKLLSNRDETWYDASVEVLEYSNNSYRRMLCNSEEGVLHTAIAGNFNPDITYLYEGKDYAVANTGAIVPPTGQDKNMTNIYIIIVSLIVIVIVFLVITIKKQ